MTRAQSVNAKVLYNTGYSIKEISKMLALPYAKVESILQKASLISGWNGFQEEKK